jgi:hypothetical protein
VPFQIGAPIDPNIPPRVTQIHESRLIVFQGVRVSRRQLSGALPGWGDSIYTRVYRALKSYASSIQNIDVLLADFAQAVYKIKGLAASLTQQPERAHRRDDGRRALPLDLPRRHHRRRRGVRAQEHVARRLRRHGRPARAQRRGGVRLADDALLGTSASGLNATGEGDDRFYFGSVSKVQTHEVAPAYLRLVEIELAIRGEDPANITHSVAFKPLWQPTELETRRPGSRWRKPTTSTSPTSVLLARGSRALAGRRRRYSMETHLDFDARAADGRIAAGRSTPTPSRIRSRRRPAQRRPVIPARRERRACSHGRNGAPGARHGHRDAAPAHAAAAVPAPARSRVRPHAARRGRRGARRRRPTARVSSRT